jgi:hypothetical protein
MQKNNLYILKRLLLILCFFNILACENLSKRRSQYNNNKQTSKDLNENINDNSKIDQELQEPEQVPVPVPKYALKKPKVGLILGPGGINTFSHLGVIKALRESNIPIDSIIGMEWGALVGALYASTQQIHKAEWEIYKLKDKDFPGESYFSKKLDPIPVQQILSRFKWQTPSAVLNFSCAAQSIYSGKLVWQKSHSIQDRLEKCMSFPPALTAKSGWIAQPFSLQEAIKEFKLQGIELIIISNVLPRKNQLQRKVIKDNVAAAILWQNLGKYYQEFLSMENLSRMGYNKIQVVQVPLSSQHIYDYSKRKTLALKGFRAAMPVANKIVEKYGF